MPFDNSDIPMMTWFGANADAELLRQFGFRIGRSGVHQTKTMMLAELSALLAARRDAPADTPAALVLEQNVTGKGTGTARRLTLERLRGLYGLDEAISVFAALRTLWERDITGRPMLALLCALARDPLLRDSAAVTVERRSGDSIAWPDFAALFERLYPERFSAKMVKSLSQNCASTWTQSGHIRGHRRKARSRAQASPESVAYAALLGSMAGYSGQLLMRSPWFQVLDRSEVELIMLLDAAAQRGLITFRRGGGVIDISVAPLLPAVQREAPDGQP